MGLGAARGMAGDWFYEGEKGLPPGFDPAIASNVMGTPRRRGCRAGGTGRLAAPYRGDGR